MVPAQAHRPRSPFRFFRVGSIPGVGIYREGKPPQRVPQRGAAGRKVARRNRGGRRLLGLVVLELGQSLRSPFSLFRVGSIPGGGIYGEEGEAPQGARAQNTLCSPYFFDGKMMKKR